MTKTEHNKNNGEQGNSTPDLDFLFSSIANSALGEQKAIPALAPSHDKSMQKLDTWMSQLKAQSEYKKLSDAQNKKEDYLREIGYSEKASTLSPIEGRLFLGYQILAYQAYVQFIQKLESRRNKVQSGLDGLISVFAGAFHTKNWLFTQRQIGQTELPAVPLNFTREQVPERPAFYKNNLQTLTMGSVLEQMSKNFRSDIDDHSFIFLCECILHGIGNGEYYAAELVRTLVEQVVINNEVRRNPNILPQNVDKKHAAAWKAAANIHIFGVKFSEKWREALVNKDDECYNAAVALLTVITQFADNESIGPNAGMVFFNNFMMSAAMACASNGYDMVTFLRKLRMLAAESNLDWMPRLLEKGYTILEYIDSTAAFYQDWVGVFKKIGEIYMTDEEIRELLEEVTSHISSKPSLVYKFDSRVMELKGLDTAQFGIVLEEDEYFILTIDLDRQNEVLDVTLAVFSEDDETQYHFAFDYMSEQMEVTLNVIDQENRVYGKDIHEGAVYLVISAFLLIQNLEDQELKVEGTDGEGSDVITLKGDETGRNPDKIVEPPQPVDKDILHVSKKRRKSKAVRKLMESKEKSKSFIDETIEQNRLMPLVTFDEENVTFESNLPQNIRGLILGQIDAYNEAVRDNIRIRNAKRFKAEYVDPDHGWRIVQIREGDFRILCRIFPDSNGQRAEVYWVGPRGTAWKYYVNS